MRQQIVAGNWKMNKTLQEGVDLVNSILEKAVQAPSGPVIFATPFPFLTTIGEQIKSRSGFHLAAQNCHHEEKGAFTGEVAVDMLASVGAEYVLIGHSERRQYFNETNAQLAKKVDLALSRNIIPIFCCGEPLDIRENGTHVAYVAEQLKDSLFHLDAAAFGRLVLAYEPIWAIGTGKTASSAQAQEMHAAIRALLADKYGNAVAQDTTILYGGSCNAQNAPDLLSQPDVDGGLIGGASLKPDDFVAIINAMKG